MHSSSSSAAARRTSTISRHLGGQRHTQEPMQAAAPHSAQARAPAAAGGGGRSPITTHILDTTRGMPAQHVAIKLEVRAGNEWMYAGEGETNSDGRVPNLLPGATDLGSFPSATFRLTFDTGSYFEAIGTEAFYPEVMITFKVDPTQDHYHVPLLLNPFGYSTYRGS
mmetsp:Transcript_7222/g.18376  ORF Transcript_7222/g.18376 Transcript_7222/m.18376 type:complete len:167 (-) Transcript_7222:32-532(-)